GNTVVQFTSTTTELMQACDIALVERGSAAIWDKQEQQMRRGMTPDALKLASFDAHWTEDGERLFGVSGNPPEPLFVLSPARLPDAHGDRWRVLAATHLHPVAGAQRVGNGRLIVVGSTAPALNHWLGE